MLEILIALKKIAKLLNKRRGGDHVPLGALHHIQETYKGSLTNSKINQLSTFRSKWTMKQTCS